MPAVIAGLVAGLVLGITTALLSLIRSKGSGGAAAAVNFFGNLIVTGFIMTWPIVGFLLPTATFFGVLPLILLDLMLAFIIALVADAAGEGLSAAPFVMLVAVIVSGATWVVQVNGPHDAKKAAFGIVNITCEFGGTHGAAAPGCPNRYTGPDNVPPASTTSDLVVVTPDQAATKASQAMSSGLAASRNFATYTNLGPATLQRVDGKMWYVFQLEFDGAGNKQRLHGVVPGYIMVSAEDPNARIIERYDGRYTMVVGLASGQGAEPMRYVRDHLAGASGYVLQDPTLEVQDQTGDPYFTVTMLKPLIGHTFQAPVAVALVNAHTGQITMYDLPGHGKNQLAAHAPWVDRVYSADMATDIANWYGRYAQAGWGGIGSTNANRFQVSGTPVLTYTGDENPSWRMLETSLNNDTSVYRVVEFDSATGAMRIYKPQGPMGIETSVAQAFCNAQGLGAGNVRSNHLVPEHMTLHVIDGELVWMASYESSKNNGATDASASDQQEGDDPDPCGNGEAPADNPTFTGVGFVPAYSVTAANAVFGSTRAQALNNLFASLAGQPGANGNAPGAGASEVVISGTIADNPQHAVPWDVSGGAKVYYITLNGTGGKPDTATVYTGTSGAGPGIVLAEPGDHITIKVLRSDAGHSQQTIQSFSDAQHPVSTPGS